MRQALDLYNEVCAECSSIVAKRYSTSFSIGIRSLAKEYQKPVYAIYGFVRFADEIVDTFYGQEQGELLQQFRESTYTAIEKGISLNPVLQSFQQTVNKYKIDRELIDAFLKSMKMDLSHEEYCQSKYEEYIHGSAEVVGLMCLKVFVGGDHEEFEKLRPAACSLGEAFQKVNFLRDMNEDYIVRERVYFPGVVFGGFSLEQKTRIEADIEQDFAAAYNGIKNLPKGAKFGVYVAYKYYLDLFEKIKNLSVNELLEKRVRVPNGKKLYLLLACSVRHRLNQME